MELLRFNKDESVYFVTFDVIDEHVVSLTFEKTIPQSYLNGFVQLNKNNGLVEGVYDKYTTLYRSYEENPLTVELSDDESVYVEPEPVKPIVRFVSNGGGKLEGALTQEVNNYEELTVPTPVPDENYVFKKWSPEIPESGVVEKDITFYALFEYVPTIDEVRSEKKNEIQNTSFINIDKGIVYDEFEFPYTYSDQSEIKNKLETAIKYNQSVTVYTSKLTQKILTVEQIKELYRQIEANTSHHRVYSYQMFAYIDSLEDKEAIKSIAYGQELESTYLEEYNKLIAQEAAIVEKYIESLESGGGVSPDISELEKTVKELSEKVTTMETITVNMQKDLFNINEALV